MIVVAHLAVLVALFAADYLTTAKGVRLGAVEINPLMRDGKRRPIYWRGIAIRAATLALLLPAIAHWPLVDVLGVILPSWTALTLFVAVSAAIVVHNLFVIKRLRRRSGGSRV